MIDLDAIKKRVPKYGGGDMKALIAEVERLRDEADLLRTGLDATRAYADRVEREVEGLRAENRKLRDVLEWVNVQCPGKCSGVCDAALRGEEKP